MRIAAILSAGLVPLFLSTAAAAETSFLVPSTEVSALVLGAQSGIVPPLQYREQVDNARAQLVLDNIDRESSYLNLRNRRNAYLGRLGDVYRTAALVEEIGEAGARVYAEVSVTSRSSSGNQEVVEGSIRSIEVVIKLS